MSKVLTSIGVEFYIGYSTMYGTLPNKNEYLKIPQVFENTEFDLDPDTIETTSYDNLKYKSYVAGLIDTGGIQSLTANATSNEDAESVWNEMVDKYEQGYQIWLCVFIPKKSTSTYIPICPIRTGAYGITLNDRITIKLKYTIIGDLVFSTTIKPFWKNSSWYHIPFFNNGNKLTSKSEIDVDDINMLFKNVFYLKGT